MRKKITKEEITQEMIRVYEENGELIPTTKEWDALAEISLGVIIKNFGSFSKAWESLDLPSGRAHKKRHKIISALKEAFVQNKNCKVSELIRAAGVTRPTVTKYFGSLAEALAVAKIDLKMHIPEEKIKEDFKTICEKVGGVPSRKEIELHGQYAPETYFRRLGNNVEAARALGYEIDDNYRADNEEAVQNLKEICDNLSRSPTIIELEREKFGYNVYRRRFGSLAEALNEVGVEVNKSMPKIRVDCPVCGTNTHKLLSHMAANHPDEFNEHNDFVLSLFKQGLSARKIAERDDVMYNGGTSVSRLIRQRLSLEEIEELRRKKIKNTLSADYESGEYDWVKEINRNRNMTEEARIKNSEGLKKSYKNRDAWNKGQTKETDGRVLRASEKIRDSVTERLISGEIEKKIGPESANWNPDRDMVAVRTRYALDFTFEDRRNIKQRANYRCEKCEISQEELEASGLSLHCDHIIPIYKGGQRDWDKNGQALCPGCHGDKTKSDMLGGKKAPKKQPTAAPTAPIAPVSALANPNLKTKKKDWDDSVPIQFEKRDTITAGSYANDLLSYNNNELSYQYLKTLTEDERDEVAKDLHNFFLSYDWNDFSFSPSDIKKDWEAIKKYKPKITNQEGVTYITNSGTSGSKLVRHFFPNLLKISSDGQVSIYDALNNNDTLFHILRNRLGNTLLYHPTKTPRQWPMNITPTGIITGAKNSGLASMGSCFKSTVAKAIYGEWCKPGARVLDYSCGFGARLIGCMATNKDLKYYGYDPNTETHANLKKLSDHFGFGAQIKCCGSEEELFDEKFDFVFSSPPYFDHEKYCDEDTQSYIKYNNYATWLEEYWRATVQNIGKMSHAETIFSVNIGGKANNKMQGIADDVVRIIEEEGWVRKDVWWMVTGKSHLSGKKGKGNNSKLEGIYFFERGW